MGCNAVNTPARPPCVRNGGKCKQKKPCGPGKGLCAVAIGERIRGYQETSRTLEQQLVNMKGDMETIQTAIDVVKGESQHLKQHQNQHIILSSTPECPPLCPPCYPIVPCPSTIPCPPCPAMVCCSQNLKQTQEKYDQLLGDFRKRLVEIGILQIDNDKVKQDLKDAEEAKNAAQDKVRELQRRLNDYKSQFGMDSLEGLSDLEKELELAKRKVRESQEQLNGMRGVATDQSIQINSYMDKCHEAEELAEEQKNQIEILEQDVNTINEQVSDELERFKGEFKEKLDEYKPLADELRDVQLAIQEADKAYAMALENNERLTGEVQSLKQRVDAVNEELERMKENSKMGEGESEVLLQQIEELKRHIEELKAEGDQLKGDLERMTEAAEEAERTAQEKLQEIAQLTAELEEVREGTERQVTRTKAMCDLTRRFLQQRIAELEERLAQSRIEACRAQRDRDEIRARMQTQVDNLRENSEAAQMRVQNLQGQIKYLEKSYKNMYPKEGPQIDVDPCFCGVQL